MRPVCLFCETPVKLWPFSPFAPCPKCKQWRQVVFIETEKETATIGEYIINYFIDLQKKECVIQASDGDYRFPLPKRKDGYALEQMLYAACQEYKLDYCSENHVKALVQNAVDSYWYVMRQSRGKAEVAQA